MRGDVFTLMCIGARDQKAGEVLRRHLIAYGLQARRRRRLVRRYFKILKHVSGDPVQSIER